MAFRVFRTAGNNLPVYRTFSRNGSLANTWIRKLKADKQGLEAIISDLKILTRAEVAHTPEGIRIKGDYRHVVKDYLGKLGF
jgi:hypothetical protein